VTTGALASPVVTELVFLQYTMGFSGFSGTLVHCAFDAVMPEMSTQAGNKPAFSLQMLVRRRRLCSSI
jgi:hypothetical protein